VPIDRVPTLIVATAVLHNLSITLNQPNDDDENDENPDDLDNDNEDYNQENDENDENVEGRNARDAIVQNNFTFYDRTQYG